MYVCICKEVTDRDIKRAVAQGACTLRDLRNTLGVATECGRCGDCARSVLKEAKQTLQEESYCRPTSNGLSLV